MAKIPAPADPTLEAVDRELERVARATRRLGNTIPMSAIGHPCMRALWYSLHAVSPATSADATGLKRMADGVVGETLMATRLKMVPGIELWDRNPETGGQWRLTACNGHVGGYVDGVILGLIQAPRTPHVWEHKQVAEDSQLKLHKAKIELGEKSALRQWNYGYWATGQVYMHVLELSRHYMTVSSPGGRHTISVRTNYDGAAAKALLERADKIIFEYPDRPPPRCSEDPAWHICRWCDHHAICHQGAMPQRHCRTCISLAPIADGTWHCGRWNETPSRELQALGCDYQLFLPGLIPGEQTDADDSGENAWIEYRMADGSTWRNEAEP